jgi:kinesin family protein 2/24
MNDYQLANEALFNTLVDQFKPAPRKASESASNGTLDIRDTLIGVRIRPLLSDELAQGHVAGVCSREDGAPIVDVHDFRQPIRGKPRLDVWFP